MRNPIDYALQHLHVQHVCYEQISSVLMEKAQARNVEEFPPAKKNVPEIAFAGRSNAGKSTLLKVWQTQIKCNHVP